MEIWSKEKTRKVFNGFINSNSHSVENVELKIRSNTVINLEFVGMY